MFKLIRDFYYEFMSVNQNWAILESIISKWK